MSESAPADDDAGFTLVELLSVIVIVGVLVAIVLPSLLRQTAKAHRATVRSDLHAVAVAQEAYFAEHGSYAADEDALATAGFARSSGVGTLRIAVYPGADGEAYCARADREQGPVAWVASSDGSVRDQPPDPVHCPA